MGIASLHPSYGLLQFDLPSAAPQV